MQKNSLFARKILRLGGYQKFRLHNVDIPDVQEYFYQKDIFPSAFLGIVDEGRRVAFWLLDSVESTDYKIPPLRVMSMHVNIAKKGAIAHFNDAIESIVLEQNGEKVVIDGGDEAQKIIDLVKAVKEKDPDIILTRGGDSFLFPYLAHRALVNGVLSELILGREEIPLKAKRRRGNRFLFLRQSLLQGSFTQALWANTHRRRKYLHLQSMRTARSNRSLKNLQSSAAQGNQSFYWYNNVFSSAIPSL